MSKNKIEITKVILKGLLVGGAFTAACASPKFVSRVLPRAINHIKFKLNQGELKIKREKYYNSFYYLNKKGLVNYEYKGKQVHISLTEEGKKRAQKYSIDDLKITKPKKWDKKWRVLIFDISEKRKNRRDALRGKIKELGLYQIQKSVWVCPYHFQKEIDVMKDFFGFKSYEMTTFIATELENENHLISYFNLGKK